MKKTNADVKELPLLEKFQEAKDGQVSMLKDGEQKWVDNPVKETPELPAVANPVLVKLDKQGTLEFKNQIELGQAAALIIQMKLAPEHLRKEGKEAVMSALTLCKQYQLPITALNELAYIKGKIGVFGHLMTALAQRHPLYGEMVVQYITKEQEIICLKNKNLEKPVWACVISIQKKGSPNWNEYFFTETEAKTAGLLGNATYGKYLKDMLFHKAKSRAYHTEYASALKGIESAEVLIHEAQVVESGPVDKMNERLGLTSSSQETFTNETAS